MQKLAFVFAALVALAGCASDSDTSTTPTTDGSTTSTPPMMDHSAKRVDVSMVGNEFVNASVTIRTGDTVRWTHNDGMSGHSVTADDGSFDSNENCVLAVFPNPLCMTEGNTFEHKFMGEGKTTYACRAHPGMTGEVIVEPHTLA